MADPINEETSRPSIRHRGPGATGARLAALLRAGRVEGALALWRSGPTRAVGGGGLHQALETLVALLDRSIEEGPTGARAALGDCRILWRPVRGGAYEEASALCRRLLDARPEDHALWLLGEALRVTLRFLHETEG